MGGSPDSSHCWDDSGRGQAVPERPTARLEDWGLEPHDISLTFQPLGGKVGVGIEFSAVANDSINDAHIIKFQ